MKTFSIALGRYQIASEDDIAAGKALLSAFGGPISDANTAEQQHLLDEADLAKLRRGEEITPPEPTTIETPPPPVTMGAGDALVFATDPADYATCRILIEHADGTKHWVNLNRNGLVTGSGWDDVPPPEEVTPAAESSTPPSETSVSVTKSKSKKSEDRWG